MATHYDFKVKNGLSANGELLDSAWVQARQSSVDLSGVDQNIVPDLDDTYSLGTPTKQWKDVYIGPGSLYVNNKKVLEDTSGALKIRTDSDQNLSISTFGSGQTTLNSVAGINLNASSTADITLTTSLGNIEINGDVSVNASKSINSSNADPINFGDAIDMNSNKIVNVLTPTADNDAATKAYVDTSISNLVNGADAAFDTLKEIQDAMATDSELSTAINNLVIPSLGNDYVDSAYVTTQINNITLPSLGNDYVDSAYVATQISNITLPSLGNDYVDSAYVTTQLSTIDSDYVLGRVSAIKSDRITVPSSATAPSNPAAGDMYYNTAEKAVYNYDGTDWTIMSNRFSATGGTITTYTSGSDTYKVHTFTTSGIFEVSGASKAVDILIVGGGGGTGATQYHNGGGGAGAVLVGSNVNLAPNSYVITVGAGGSGGTQQGGGTDNGQPGGNSSFGSLATANGGGAGGTYPDTPGDAGGCGGGGAGNGNTVSWTPGSSNQSNYSGFTKYGNSGGSGSNNYSAGGGGGAGGAGQGGNVRGNGYAGNGGVGIQNSFRTGSPVTYGGGGGGSSNSANLWGLGGSGGGGRGSNDHTAENGTANTGGGAGGPERDGTQTNGKNGGSGIVVVRYVV